jgi:hypothetical protein
LADRDCQSQYCKEGVCTDAGKRDTDGDGMPDAWEDRNGLKKDNPNDAGDDPDKDRLTNLEEYKAGTDPNSADTDGDGTNDKDEIDQGFNPKDPESHPSSSWLLIVIIIVILIVLGVVGYIIYTQMQEQKKQPPQGPPRGGPGQGMPPWQPRVAASPPGSAGPPQAGKSPEELARDAVFNERSKSKLDERNRLFDIFGAGQKPEEPQKAGKPEEEMKGAPPQKKEASSGAGEGSWISIKNLHELVKGKDSDDIVQRMKDRAEADEKSGKDVFKRLDELAKKGEKRGKSSIMKDLESLRPSVKRSESAVFKKFEKYAKPAAEKAPDDKAKAVPAAAVAVQREVPAAAKPVPKKDAGPKASSVEKSAFMKEIDKLAKEEKRGVSKAAARSSISSPRDASGSSVQKRSGRSGGSSQKSQVMLGYVMNPIRVRIKPPKKSGSKKNG